MFFAITYCSKQGKNFLSVFSYWLSLFSSYVLKLVSLKNDVIIFHFGHHGSHCQLRNQVGSIIFVIVVKTVR